MKNIIFLTLSLFLISTVTHSNGLTWDESKQYCPKGTVIGKRYEPEDLYHCYCCNRGTTGHLVVGGVICKASEDDLKQVNEKWGHLSGKSYDNALEGMLTDRGEKCGDLQAGTSLERVHWERDRDYTLADQQKKRAVTPKAIEALYSIASCQSLGRMSSSERVILCDGKAYSQLTGLGFLAEAAEQLEVGCQKTFGKNLNEEKECAIDDKYACCYIGSFDRGQKRYYKRMMDFEEARILSSQGIDIDNSKRDAQNGQGAPVIMLDNSNSATPN